MLRKNIKYVDYNGEEREEDFYFNLSKAELMEMELSVDGSLSNSINQIIAEKDHKKIIEIFKKIILKAYGIKSPDGKRFMKSEEISNNFACTEAYSELFMELATNEESAVNFINGIIPQTK